MKKYYTLFLGLMFNSFSFSQDLVFNSSGLHREFPHSFEEFYPFSHSVASSNLQSAQIKQEEELTVRSNISKYSSNYLLQPGDTIRYSGSTTFCAPGSILLTANNTVSSAICQWSLNGAVIPGAVTNTYNATQSGSYSVIVSNPPNLGPYDTLLITVNPAPVSSFTFSPNNACSHDPVYFTNNSSGAVSYAWNFGDPNAGGNNSSTLSDPIHRFIGITGNASQNFTVTLVSTNSFGCTNTYTTTVTTLQSSSTLLNGTGATTYNGLPYFSDCSGIGSGAFTFVNASTSSNNHYRIEWGDLSAAYDAATFTSTVHTYSAGTYSLLFIVTDINGCTDTGFYHVFVGSNPAVGLGNPGNTSICTGNSITFPITGTAGNPSATIYTLYFNDGTSNVVYNHPAPASVTHTYLVGSCGTNVPGYSNSFATTVIASNACANTTATVSPIYVSQKAHASFSITPRDTVCVTTTVTFTNTGLVGDNVSSSGCHPGKSVWTISPTTGWTTSSNLGNDNGLADPSLWSAGDVAINVLFSTSGTYSIKLKAGGSVLCGLDSITKTICVNPVPVAAFTATPIVGCVPLAVSTNNTPSSNNCGNNTYTWSVSYSNTSGCLPNAGAFSYTGGTGATSQNPQFLFTNPGIYTLTLIAHSPAGTCNSLPVTQTITVKDKPAVTINAIAAICENQSISPGSTVLNCYATTGPTYLWSFPSGSPSSSTAINPGPISYSTAGIYSATLAVTNECGTTTVNKQVTVNTVTVSSAGPGQSLCGTSAIMAANTAIIGTGLWSQVSGPTTATIVTPSSPTTTINNLIPGTYVFRWTITNGSCVSFSTVSITVLAGGTPSIAGPNQSLCLATSTTLAGNTPIIGTGLWTQVTGAAATITTPNSPGTTVTGLTPGIYTFRWTISFSNCNPSSSDVVITIYDSPTIANAGPDQTICASTATLSGNTPAPGHRSGIWLKIAGPAGGAPLSPTSATTNITGLIPGTYTYTWTISNGACPSSNDTVAITVTAVPTTANAGPDQSLCALTQATLNGNNPAIGTGLWTQISGPNTATITSATSTTTTVTSLITGSYTFRWTISNGVCASSSDDLIILISDNPTTSNAGPDQTICGTIATMAANTPSIGTGLWSIVSGGAANITSSTQPNTTITALTPGIHVFKWTITNGACTNSSNVSITVVASGTVANAGPDQSICAATSAILAGNIPSSGTGIWSQFSGAPAIITTPSSPNSTVTGLTPGAYTFRWTISFSNCSPSTDDVVITIYDLPTNANAGTDQTICANTTNLSANTPTPGNGAGTWTRISGPAGGFITTNSSPTTSITSLIPGQYAYKWTISNGSCPPSSDTVLINVTASPTIANAGLDQSLCALASATLTGNSPIAGNGLWSQVAGPGTSTITSPSSASTAVTGLIPGTYIFTWTISNGVCSPSIDSVNIVIYAPATVSMAGPKQIICGTSVTMAADSAIVGIGHWSQVSGPSVASIGFPTSPSTTITNLITGSYIFKWTITNGACISTSNDTVSVVAGGTIANAGPNQSLCSVTSTQLNANTPLTGTGSWSQVGGTAVTITNTSSPTTTITNLLQGNYIFRWTITFSNCPPSVSDVTISIFDLPTTSNAGPDQTICAATTSMAANTPLPGHGNGTWAKISGPAGGNITSINAATTGITSLVPGVYAYMWTISNGTCTSSVDTILINVTPGPTAANAGPDQLLCAATSTSLSGNPPVIGTGVWAQFSGPNTAVIIQPSSGTTSITGLITGTYIFTWTISNGVCPSSFDSVKIIITPPLLNTISGRIDTVCTGTIYTTTAPAAAGGNNTAPLYQWQSSTNGITFVNIPGAISINYTFVVNANTWLRRIATIGPCTGNSDTTLIKQIPGPAQAQAGPDQSLCYQDSTILTGNITNTGNMLWKKLGVNNSILSNPTSPITSIRNLLPIGPTPAVYLFEYSIDNTFCPPTKDTVTITVYPKLNNIIGPINDTICSGQSFTINSLDLSGGNNPTYIIQWQQSPDGITWANIPAANNPAYTYGGLSSIYLRRSVQSLPCSNFSDTVHIVVQSAISNNIIIGDVSICINTAAPIITGSIPSGGNGVFIYSWEMSIDNGATWSPIAGATLKDYNPGVLIVTTKYRRKVSTNLCAGPQALTSNIVTITVNPDAKALYNPTDTIGCAPFQLTGTLVNAQPFPTRNSQYLWYVNNSLIGTGIPFPGYTMLNNNDSIILKLVTISIFGCRNDSISHKFITRIRANPSFSLSDTVGCGPLNVLIQNTTPNSNLFTYLWTFGNGQTSTATQPGFIIFPPNPLYGDTTYSVRLKTFSPCDTITISKNILVHSRPKALFTPGSTFGCSPFKVLFTNTSKGFNNTYLWQFGDGTSSTSSADTISHVYNTGIRDTFYVTLKATNICGTDSLRYSIIVTPNTIHLLVGVNGTELNSCAPSLVHFINNSSGAQTFFWQFGDGSSISTTSNVDTVTHLYVQPGIYTVLINAVNGCSDTTVSKVISVFRKPTANFIADKYTACIGDTIHFTNQSDSANSYLWQFGDGGISTSINPVHAYQLPGLYNVILKSTRLYGVGVGCTDSIIKTINIVSSLPGSFSMSDSIASCAPFNVTFTNQTTPSTSATWDFGDGTTGIGNIVTHTYLAPGSYLVKLIVFVPGGCKYISQRPLVIGGPSGSLQYTNGFVCNQQQVRFEVTTNSSDSLFWQFGDGTTLTTLQHIVFHLYNFAGVYLPNVTLRSIAGCQFLIPGIDTIKVDKIKAGFISAQQHNCGSTSVTFTDTSRAYFNVINRNWDFGDGTFGSGTVVTHLYNSTGIYNVRLIAAGNSGCRDTSILSVFVKVNNRPIAAIQGDTSGCTFSQISYTAIIQSSDSVNFISWTSSNGITSNGNPFIITFTLPGIYTIRLVEGTVNGCYDTAFGTIHIYLVPTVTAGNDFYLCRGNSAQLTATGAATYNWIPIQGLSCSSCASPIANPLVTTPYIVKGTNAFGCAGYDTIVITVIQPLHILVSPDVSICINQSANLLASGATSYLWSPSLGLSSTTISNPVATPQNTIRYRVVGYDGYNCFTDTAFVTVAVGQYPTVNLGPDLTLAAGTLYTFTPVITNGPITSWLWTPSTDLNCTTCPAPTATIKKDITYFVQVKNNYGCPAYDTLKIKVFCESSQVFIPNAFTPDGDGINDILMVRGSGIVTVKSFRIFNRWGELVFERSNFPPNDPTFGWDGKVKGLVGEPAVYVYTAEVICENGSSFTYKGNTCILK